MVGVLSGLLAAGYFLQLPWALGTWPSPEGRLSNIFVSSILATVAAAMLWTGISGRLAGAAGGFLHVATMLDGAASVLWPLALQRAQPGLTIYAVGCTAAALACFAAFLWVRCLPVVDDRPLQQALRVWCALYILIIVPAGVALIARVPGIMPWPLKPKTSNTGARRPSRRAAAPVLDRQRPGVMETGQGRARAAGVRQLADVPRPQAHALLRVARHNAFVTVPMSIFDAVLATVQAEFSDLLDAEQLTRVVLRMGVALLLGAAIGWDREKRDAEAGLRTHMLVALGAAVFVLVPAEAGMTNEELSRVVQGIVSGIGFLGAGAVLKNSEEGRIHGLTTAGSIWATAAVGIAAGLGRESTAVLATLFVLLVLAAVRRLARGMKGRADPAS